MRHLLRSSLLVVTLLLLFTASLMAAAPEDSRWRIFRERPATAPRRAEIIQDGSTGPAVPENLLPVFSPPLSIPAPLTPDVGPDLVPDGIAQNVPPAAGVVEAVPAPQSELPVPIPPPRQATDSAQPSDRPDAGARGEFGFDVEEPNNDDYRLLVQAARNAVRLGDPTTAEARYRDLLTRFPDAAAARSELAGLLLNGNRIEEAAEQYRVLIQMWPNNAGLRRAFGGALSRLGQNRPALVELRRALDLDPRDESAAVELTRLLGQLRSFPEAYEVYLKYLARLDQRDERVQRLLAPLLLGIDRPMESRNLYAQLAGAYPNDVALLTDYIRASVIFGDHAETMVLVRQLSSKVEVDAKVLTDLGKVLYDFQDDAASLAIFQQVLAVNPEDAAARVGAARVYLRNLEIPEAWSALEACGHHCRDSEYLLARANLHLIVGEYGESIALCEELLRSNTCNADAHLALADALAADVQDALAAAHYRAAVACAPESVRLRAITKQAQHLSARRYFKPAIALLRALAAEDPSDAFTIAILVQVLTDAGDPEEGIHVGACAMNPPCSYPRREVLLRAAMGRALLKQGAFQPALQQYREASALPTYERANVIYGIYRASSILGLGVEAQQNIMTALAKAEFPTGRRMLLADEAVAYCDYHFAGLMLTQAVREAPENPAALNRLGELQLKTYFEDLGVRHFQQSLAISPANLRARAGLARALALNRHPAASIAVYQDLLKFQPMNIQMHREMARVVDQWKGYPAAAPVYDEALAMGSMIMAHAHLVNPVCEPGVFVLGFEQVDGEVAAVNNERQAKAIDGWKPLAAVPIYQGEQELEPANIDAHFSLGQVYGGLNWTHASMDEYAQILEIDPCHRDSHIALERARLELRPQSISNLSYFEQNGRDGLAAASQFRLTENARLSLGDEDEYIEAGYGYLLYGAPQMASLKGNMARMRVQRKCHPCVVALAEVRVEEFDFGFDTRPLFDVGLQARIMPDLDFRPTMFMENVVQSAGSILQDIYRIGVNLEAQYRPTPWWTIDSLYRIADYSDTNLLNEFGIHNAFRVHLPPHQIRILADYDFQNYKYHRTTVPIGASILDLEHPYFAPAGFSYLTLGTEWKHWLSPDMFKGADQLWYQLYFGGRVDSTSQAYFVFRASLEYDFRSWITCSVGTSLVSSSVYDNRVVGAQLVIRFP